MKPARIKAVRELLKLTQEKFCETYGFKLKTYRDYEQGARKPKGTALFWLWVIHADPMLAAAIVKQTLEKRKRT